MSSFLSIVFIGNVGKTPELRKTQKDESVCSFSVAVNEVTADGQESVTWFDVSAWGRLAEVCAEYLVKGSKVLIRASNVKTHAFTYENGEPGASLKVTAREVKFLGSPRREEQQSEIPF